MPVIDFYVLQQEGEQHRLLQACKLIERIWLAGQHVHVQLVSQSMAQQFDDDLWTFRQGSFVAHEPPGSAAPDPVRAVTLGFGATLPPQCEYVVNLSEQIPEGFAGCQRIAEFVSPDEVHRQQARNRYRQYRQAGCTLQNHES